MGGLIRSFSLEKAYIIFPSVHTPPEKINVCTLIHVSFEDV